MTDVSVEKFNIICRLCMSALANGAHEIFQDNTDTPPKQILEKIALCLQLKVDEEDKLPQSVCESCALKLDEFYSYRQSCLKTEVILLKCLDKSTSTQLLPRKTCLITKENTTLQETPNDTIESELRDGDLKEFQSSVTQFTNDEKLELLRPKREATENNLSDVEMSPPCENVGMSEEEDDEEMEEEKEIESSVVSGKSLMVRTRSLPELAEPSPDDYVLMKEETFNLDPVKDLTTNKSGATSSILADYLIEFSNSRSGEAEVKDKDVLESQKLRREILPPMWDVYEKSVMEKENIASDGSIGEKERQVTVTHRRYIINKGAFPCSLCGDCFEFDQGKRRDDYSEEKSKLYDCLTCGKVFPRRSSWKRHQSTHEDIKPFVCRICNKGFNRKEHLNRHILSHGSVRPYGCNNCGKQFVRKEHLTRHQLCNPACAVPLDNVLRPFGCDVCSQGFVRKEHLIRHRKRAHDLDAPEGETEPKPFTCTVCTKTFTRREHLKRHQLIHQRDFTASAFGNLSVAAGARLFAGNCNSKDESFASELSIFPATSILPEITLSEVAGNSIENENTNVNNLFDACHEMNESGNGIAAGEDSAAVPQFSGANEEDVEMDDDSEEPLPPIPVLEMNANAMNITPSVVDISKSNTFCNVCFKNFSRRSHLLRHMKRIHSMQLPPSSRRKSQQQQTLVQNKSGDENGNSLTDSASVTSAAAAVEQIYKCQLCGKVFSRKSHLERHEKNIHQLDKEANQPYECVTCGETFIQSKLLDKHMQVHGNTVPENYVWI